MATWIEPPFGNQIVLHLDIAANETADAEVVGLALVAWVAAAQAASQVLDPFTELRVGLLTVEPGSVRIRALFEFFETKVIGPPAEFLTPYPRIKRIAQQLAIATTIGIPTGLAIVVGEHLLYPDPPVALPEVVKQEYREDQQKLGEAPAVRKKVQAFYKTVQKDRMITGVSVRDGETMQPLVEVPKGEFSDRSGLWSLQDPDAPTRPQGGIWDVVVTHPALFSKPKPWKFLRDGLPFSAMMSDEHFLRAMALGTLPLHIQEGVKMRVQVEWTERQDGQIWEPIKRSYRITKVIDPRPLPGPAPLLGQ